MAEEKNPPRIFAAENESTWQWTIEEAVKEVEGILVVPIVADFESAMELIQKLIDLKVDIAIIDGNLSEGHHDGEEGVSMVSLIKKLAPDIKIIGYSAYGKPLEEAGADIVIDKINYEELAPTILRLMAE